MFECACIWNALSVSINMVGLYSGALTVYLGGL